MDFKSNESELEICPLCGKKTAKIEGLPEGYGWNIVRCNCFTFHIHESIAYQLNDKGKDIEINKRKRYNCIYQTLLKQPVYNNYYYYKFFYDETTKGEATKEPIYINIADKIDDMPKTTDEKIKVVIKSLLDKYGLNTVIKVADLDMGLVFHEEEGDVESLISYLYDNNLIYATSVSSGTVNMFKMNINSKLYLENGEKMTKQPTTETTNITNNYNDNSVNVSAGKNIKKANIGSNTVSTNKETMVETKIETNIEKKEKGNWLKKIFRR